ncbi:hypothetical protein [Pseudonocardia cypriaca]|uniref:Uncharacterized protein n=1 Tax=Pseudonocardia cypriaca TaxID=882449 RepID=A0A543GCQ3_9PSEU|nr:hypothetical protein [Pseudonocardia cypriaca]TQM43873.1 hypothetical protein FB388_1225 [Pseudonocardia cypriaca]
MIDAESYGARVHHELRLGQEVTGSSCSRVHRSSARDAAATRARILAAAVTEFAEHG